MVERRLLAKPNTWVGNMVLVGSSKLFHMLLEFLLVITKFPVCIAPFDTRGFSLLLDLHNSHPLGAMSTSCPAVLSSTFDSLSAG